MTKIKTKTKTKMPKLRREASPPTQREWDEYSRQMVQYVSEQLARKDAQIAALKRKVEGLVEECIQVCLDQRNPGNLNYKPSEMFADALKLHFGVSDERKN